MTSAADMAKRESPAPILLAQGRGFLRERTQQCTAPDSVPSSLPGFSPGIRQMSEALLYDYSQQLRLLARANVRTTADGRLLSGTISYALELLRGGLGDAIDHLQDHGRLRPVDEAVIETVTRTIEANRLKIRFLRREVEALEAAAA
jgi:hypothetical protein